MNECRWCRTLFQGVDLHLHALHSGRSIEEWQELRQQAAEGSNSRTAQYLLGEPMLGDLLAEGLDEFGLYWSDGRATAVR